MESPPHAASPGSRRYWKMTGGFLALSAGIVLSLPLVPGPGIPLILLGLVLLSDDFAWARRALQWSKSRWRHFRERP
jgi:hypothetical protein